MCSATVERKRQDEHKCGKHVCYACKECVVSPLVLHATEPPKEPNEKLLFYDFETDFSAGKHVVNFAVAQYARGVHSSMTFDSIPPPLFSALIIFPIK